MSDSRNLVNNTPANRIQWIDFAKGIVMLTVILCHSVKATLLGEIVRGAVISFNMPMFFALSCMTFHFSTSKAEWWRNTKKGFRHLIVPALIMYLHIVVAELLMGKGSDPQFFIKKLLCLLFANGVWYDLKNVTVPEIGVLWFLFALFFGRSIYDLLRCTLKRKVFYPVVFALSIIAMIIGQYVYLPFSLDVAIAVFPFFLLGEHFKELKLNNHKNIWIISCFLVWIATMILSFLIDHMYFELACRRYTLFPLCYFGAVSGIILVYYFSTSACGLRSFGSIFQYIGKNSLTLLCVHAMDFVWAFAWKLPLNEFICAFLRIVIDIMIFYIVMQIKKGVKQLRKA